jgi:outer membrane protein TolC
MLNVMIFFVAMTAAAGAAQQSGTNAPATPQAPTQTPQQSQTIETYVVGTAKPPVVEGSRVMELTLEQAYNSALEKNLDLKAARMNPQGVDYQLQSAHAVFQPQITSSYSYRNSQSPSNNALEGVANLTNTTTGFNGGMNQQLPWYGTSFQASFTNSRQATNDITRRINPSFTSGLSFSASLPLLANFKMDNQRNQLRTLAISRQVSDINLVQTIENTKSAVRSAYWALRAAIEQIEINRIALAIAKKSYDDSLLKVEIGTMAPIDTTQFDVSLANAEQGYLQSQISWRTAELNLKRLIVSGTDDDVYLMTLSPTSRPELSVQSVDIQAAVTKALAERTDLTVARRNIDSSRLSLEVTAGQLKPNLTLNGGYSATGQGGTERTNTGTIPAATGMRFDRPTASSYRRGISGSISPIRSACARRRPTTRVPSC